MFFRKKKTETGTDTDNNPQSSSTHPNHPTNPTNLNNSNNSNNPNNDTAKESAAPNNNRL